MTLLLWAILGVLCFMAGPLGWLFFSCVLGWVMVQAVFRAIAGVGIGLGNILRSLMGRRRS